MHHIPITDPVALERLINELQDVTSALAQLISAAYSASFVLREESERGIRYPAGMRQSIGETWLDGLARYAATRSTLDAVDALLGEPADERRAA